MRVSANQVYVIAPNTDMTLSHDVLQLVPRTETGGQHLSIDTFLRSLAENRAERVMGVILSGMAADGTCIASREASSTVFQTFFSLVLR